MPTNSSDLVLQISDIASWLQVLKQDLDTRNIWLVQYSYRLHTPSPANADALEVAPDLAEEARTSNNFCYRRVVSHNCAGYDNNRH